MPAFPESASPALSHDKRCLRPKGWTRLECEHGSVIWAPRRCRHCPPCDRAKKAKQIARAVHGTVGHEHVAFVTLTSLPHTTWQDMMSWFPRIIRFLRTYEPTLQYAAYKQEGPLHGMKHLHILVTPLHWVPQADLSKRWEEIAGAWDVNIRRVNSEGVAGYVSAHNLDWSADLRKIVTYSKGWPKLPHDDTWHVTDWTIGDPPIPLPKYESSEGHLIEYWAEGCEHVRGPKPLSLETLNWLSSIMDRWPRLCTAVLVR